MRSDCIGRSLRTSNGSHGTSRSTTSRSSRGSSAFRRFNCCNRRRAKLRPKTAARFRGGTSERCLSGCPHGPACERCARRRTPGRWRAHVRPRASTPTLAIRAFRGSRRRAGRAFAGRSTARQGVCSQTRFNANSEHPTASSRTGPAQSSARFAAPVALSETARFSTRATAALVSR